MWVGDFDDERNIFRIIPGGTLERAGLDDSSFVGSGADRYYLSNGSEQIYEFPFDMPQQSLREFHAFDVVAMVGRNVCVRVAEGEEDDLHAGNRVGCSIVDAELRPAQGDEDEPMLGVLLRIPVDAPGLQALGVHESAALEAIHGDPAKPGWFAVSVPASHSGMFCMDPLQSLPLEKPRSWHSAAPHSKLYIGGVLVVCLEHEPSRTGLPGAMIVFCPAESTDALSGRFAVHTTSFDYVDEDCGLRMKGTLFSVPVAGPGPSITVMREDKSAPSQGHWDTKSAAPSSPEHLRLLKAGDAVEVQVVGSDRLVVSEVDSDNCTVRVVLAPDTLDRMPWLVDFRTHDPKAEAGSFDFPFELCWTPGTRSPQDSGPR